LEIVFVGTLANINTALSQGVRVTMGADGDIVTISVNDGGASGSPGFSDPLTGVAAIQIPVTGGKLPGEE
jgi:hypothetical protein